VERRTARPSNAAPAKAACARALARLGAALVLAWCAAPSAHAEGPFSATAGVTTDYILRGVSQTYGGAALQLGASYQDSLGWFAGAWGSNVNPYPAAAPSRELDVFAGYARALGPDFTARVAYTHYKYLADPRRAKYDYDEFALTATYVDRLAVTVSYLPRVTAYSQLGYAADQPLYSVEASARWPLPRDFSLTAGAGFYDLEQLFGVRYWAGSVGVMYATRHLQITLARYIADRTVERLYEDATSDHRVVLSAFLRF